MKFFKRATSEEGYTMVEQLVALALFMAVLLPAVTFFIFMTHQTTIENKITARSLAQQEMEMTLLNKTYVDQKEEVSERNWILVKKISEKDSLVTIHIKVVASKNADEPIITLKTIRYAVEK